MHASGPKLTTVVHASGPKLGQQAMEMSTFNKEWLYFI